MEVDPLASMRLWAIEVQIGDVLLDIPALPAADWWPVLTSGDMSEFLDLTVSRDGIDLDEMILTGEVSSEELNQAYREAIQEITGRPYQTALVLAAVARSQWPSIGGRMAERGFRWDVMPIGAALDAVYSIVMGSLPEKSEDGKRKPREDFLALLDRPLPGQKREVDRERMVSEFEAMAGPRPTGGAVAKSDKPPTSRVRSSAGPSDSARPRIPPRPRRPRQGGRSREPRRRPSPPG